MGEPVMVTTPFARGLNTEISPLHDTTDFTNDELNMTILPNHSRTRRLGLDYEELFKFNRETLDLTSPKLAFNCVEWTDINSPDERQEYNIPYLVCQVGGLLIFFRNHGSPYSQDQASFTYDLKQHALDPEKDDYATTRCSFSAAYGCIFVSSKAIKPFYLRTAQEEKTEPLPPGQTNRTRVSCSVMCTKKGRARGFWNIQIFLSGRLVMKLENKITTPSVAGWQEAFGRYVPPSNVIAEAFNKVPSEERAGITAVPRFKEATPDWWGIRSPEGDVLVGTNQRATDWITFVTDESSSADLKGSEMKIIIHSAYIYRDSTSYHDDVTVGYFGGAPKYERASGLNLQIRDTIGAQDYLAVDTEPEKLSYAHLYNLLNQGWTPAMIGDFYKSLTGLQRFPGNNLAQYYLKDSKTSKFKPEALINMTFGNTPAPRGHYIIDYFNQNRMTPLALENFMSQVATAAGKTVDDIIDKDFPHWNDPEAQVPVVIPRKDFVTDSIAYAGRIFYLCGDVVLYSQMLNEEIERANYCYTAADPTSEEISDIIDTDGGLLSVPSIGEGVKLTTTGSYLVIFGDKGAVAVTGTANNIFTATAHQQGVINAVPSQAPQSFVVTSGGTLYWGLTGIYALIDNGQGLQVQNLSQDTIQTFYGSLTNIQQQYCKGIYNSAAQKVYWFYPGNEELPRSLNKCLVLDLATGAFAPQEVASIDTIPDDSLVTNIPEVVSGVSLSTPFISEKEYPLIAEYITKPDQYSDKVYGYLDSAKNKYFTKDLINAFTDKECTQPWGTVQQLIDSGDCVLDTIYQSIVRERKGTDHLAISLPWKNDLGLGEEIYQAAGTSEEYVSGTVTAAFDPRFTVDLDATRLPSRAGRIEYKWYRLTEATKGDEAKFPRKEIAVTYTQADTGTFEIVDDSGVKILADDPLESERYSYKAALLLCLDTQSSHVTFGEFRNNKILDWAAGDQQGSGFPYESYLISHPVNAGDFTKNKTMPHMQAFFKRTETGKDLTNQYIYGSNCEGSVLWDWRVNGEHSKWDSPQELYRPNHRTILSEGQVSSRSLIRGMGRSFQVKIEGLKDNNFVLEALGFSLRGDNR